MQENEKLLILSLGAAVIFLFFVSLFIGSNPVPVFQAAREAFSLSLSADGKPSIIAIILTEIRLPRALIGAFAGATLGLCGAVMQGLLRNPLASPGLIGSSSGAALGAVILLYFGLGYDHIYALPLGGILGALGATVVVYFLAGRGAGTLTLILAGVAINSLSLALISLLLNLAPSPFAVKEIVLWMMGSIANRSMNDFLIMLPGVLVGWIILAGTGRALDALTLGEETAHTMGIDLVRLRWRIFLAVALALGSVVSITGSIGFIGLVVPHLLRPLVGYQPRKLLLLSALGGAALLLTADICVRLFPAGSDIKVGVLTSLVGAPFFLYLIIKGRKYES
ncbi:iron ABC transporter permease [Motiliproteus sp. MSK22-1]|uniref:FecCD family ABC transporter permease n=1 Tax=Motiliproteus sp. MSK22-1 TaxID=1897630 RepID=UPI00097547E3|nr:iron ABC transporter permease [Motiliproteus sp. MSK22-1]OMH37519.1 ABC transporter permease [Motiliproteus sp. MSK22-1]